MPTARTQRQDAPERRGVTINLRASRRLRELIDRAASASGKTRSEFMLDSACRRAEEVLLDQRFFMLDEKQYQRFLDVLDAPSPPNAKLRKLLARAAS